MIGRALGGEWVVEGGSEVLLFKFWLADIAGQADCSVIFGKGTAKIRGLGSEDKSRSWF